MSVSSVVNCSDPRRPNTIQITTHAIGLTQKSSIRIAFYIHITKMRLYRELHEPFAYTVSNPALVLDPANVLVSDASSPK